MAIMKLNRMAEEPVYKDKVVFMTVNCDECVLFLASRTEPLLLHMTKPRGTLELTERE